MKNKADFERYVSAGYYTEPVEIKRLKFIYSLIEKYKAAEHVSHEDVNILEVACGSGGLSLPMASLGCKVVAFDLNNEYVSTLESRIKQAGIQNLKVSVEDGYTFDDGEKYNIVVASEVFEHVQEPSRLLENILKRVTNGSYLIVTIPNGYGPWELKNRIDILRYMQKWNFLRRLLGKSDFDKDSGLDHCQFYTRKRFLNLFSSYDIELIDFARSDSILTLISPLRKSRFFGGIDIALADILPYWLASGWYFAFKINRIQ